MPNSGGAFWVAAWISVVNTSMRAGPPDQPRHLVGRHAEHEQQQRGREDRRAQQRQRDLRHHLPVARARDQRRLFHAHVEHAQRRPEREIGEREVVARQRPDHAAHGVDAERRLREPEPVLDQRIDPADVGAEHEDPGHRGEQARDRERQQRERMEQRAERRVGALHHQGHQPAHAAASPPPCRRRRSANCRTAAGCASSNRPRRNSRARPGRAEAGVLGEGGVEQRRQRHEHQPAGDQHAGDEREVARTDQRGEARARTRRCAVPISIPCLCDAQAISSPRNHCSDHGLGRERRIGSPRPEQLLRTCAATPSPPPASAAPG